MASNGKLPDSDLEALSTPGRLRSDAAASFERLLDDTGTTGTEGSAEAYRTYQQQEDIFTDRYQRSYCEYAPGKVDARTWQGDTWYRKPGEAAAAVPGTSNHGWGTTVDFQNLGGYGSSSWERFADIAPGHGWSNKEGASVDESWHWSYDATRDTHMEASMDASDFFDYALPLNSWMEAQFDDGKETLTTKGALGYMAAGAFTAANNSVAILARLDTIVANQETIKEALADLTVNVELELRPLLAPLTVELTGSVSQTEPPPAAD
jgi:hypothetical protein